MKYFCLDTSGTATAVGAKGERRAFLTDDGFVKASRALMPTLDICLNKAGLDLKEAEFAAVVVGPGSFTGVRIGVSAARALAYALGIETVSINSCELAAYNSRSAARAEGKERILTLSDAGNGYCFASVYSLSGEEIVPITCLSGGQLDAFKEAAGDCHIAADGKYAEIFGVEKVSGDGLIDIAEEKYLARGGTDFRFLEPLYVRVSQAEMLKK